MNIVYPKVSIVIPVYNGSNFLSEAIDSALSQTYKNIEIIVVNDGSNDEGATEKIALSYGDKIRYFSKENGGVASALNFAIGKMRGEYFSWLSHDDLYYENKIEKQIDFLHNLGSGKFIIYSDYRYFIDKDSNYPIVKMRAVTLESFRYYLVLDNNLHGCSLLIPKEAFVECGLFDESLRTTQDYDLWFRMAEKYKFIHVPECLVKSRTHTAQGSRVLSATVVTESDTLVCKFIKNLSVKELESGANASAVEALQLLADVSIIRGRKKSAEAAEARIIKLGGTVKSLITTSSIIKYKIKDALKRILPNVIILKLKNILYKLKLLK